MDGLPFLLFNVLLNNFIGDIARGHGKVAPAPEVTSPVEFAEVGKGGEYLVRAFALNELGHFAYRIFGRNGEEEMDVIRGYLAAHDFKVILGADLPDEIPNRNPDGSGEYLLAIFRDPDEMHLQIVASMGAGTIALHRSLPYLLSDEVSS